MFTNTPTADSSKSSTDSKRTKTDASAREKAKGIVSASPAGEGVDGEPRNTQGLRARSASVRTVGRWDTIKTNKKSVYTCLICDLPFYKEIKGMTIEMAAELEAKKEKPRSLLSHEVIWDD